MKTFWCKLGLFFVLTAAGQALMALLGPRVKLPNLMSAARSGAVVMLGDSVNRYRDPNDRDRRSIGELLDGRLPDRTVIEISSGGYDLKMFAIVARFLAAQEKRPAAVVIPINLRAFNAVSAASHADRWKDEEYVAEGGTQFTYNAFWRPLAVFKAVDLHPFDPQAYADVPIHDGEPRIGVADEFTNLEQLLSAEGQARFRADRAWRRDYVAFCYLYRIAKEHPLMVDLAAAVRTLRQAGIRPVVYVTPIDWETCAGYYGPGFRESVEQNVGRIRQLLAEHGADLLDMTFDLGAEEFSYILYPNEHLKENGRQYVARRLAEQVSGPVSF